MSAKKLQDTGERMIPAEHGDSLMYAEHMSRYLAASQLVAGKTVLDVATGTGYGAKIMAATAKKVFGVDNASDAIAYATEHYSAKNIEYITSDAAELPLKDSSIDLIVSFETIEHVQDAGAFLRELRRVLKPDGLIVLSTPNDEEFAEGNHFHVHQYTRQELEKLLQETFSNVVTCAQASWAYVQVSDQSLLSGDDAALIDVHNFSPLKPDQYSYFFMLCSDRKVTEKIKPVAALGGHYSAKEMDQARKAELAALREDFEMRLKQEKNEHRKTLIKLKAKEREIHDITTSSSYKLARMLAASKQLAKKGYNQTKELNPRRVRMLRANKRHVRMAYARPAFYEALQAAPTAKLAVIIHLYYTDMFPLFLEKLERLQPLSYDLYLTIPEGKEQYVEPIREEVPNARISIVPNCGRDVLPFVQVMKQIEKHGYTSILKLHSKKSPHRVDGEQWRDKIVDSLIPSNPAAVQHITRTLQNADLALIGPEGEYVSLLVNFSATAHYLKMLTGKIISGKVADELIRTADEYGFFAGTMFWARTEALWPVIHNVNVEDFEPELGQEDSTLAHALERLFNIIPEAKDYNVYEMHPDGPVKIDHHTTNIPAWSEVAIEEE